MSSLTHVVPGRFFLGDFSVQRFAVLFVRTRPVRFHRRLHPVDVVHSHHVTWNTHNTFYSESLKQTDFSLLPQWKKTPNNAFQKPWFHVCKIRTNRDNLVQCERTIPLKTSISAVLSWLDPMYTAWSLCAGPRYRGLGSVRNVLFP